MSSKITQLAALAAAHADDLLLAVDVHDTSMAATGTTKKLTVGTLLAASGAGVINPKSATYGAVGNGIADDTTALSNALTDAMTGQVPLYIPPGTYLTGPLTVTADVAIWGAGKHQSALKLKNASNGYVITLSTAGFLHVDVRDLGIDGNAGNQSSGGCILAAGAVQSSFERLHLSGAYDVALWLYQNSISGVGHHNRVTQCLFDGMNTVTSANQQGIRCQASDENYIAFNDFEDWGGFSATPGSEPYAIKDWSGLQQIVSNVFVGGQEAIRCQDISSTRIIGNTFDGVGRAGIHLSGSKNVVMGNLFSDGSSASAGAYAQCEIDNSTSAVVDGNAFTVTSVATVRNCIREFGTSSINTIAANNVIDLSGGSLYSTGKAIELHGYNSAARSNPGYNPVQALAVPAAPALTPGTPGTMTGGTYQAKVTLVTTEGETAASAAASATVAASGKLDVAAPAMTGNAKGWYAYITIAGGSTFYRQQAAGSPTGMRNGYTQTAEPSTAGATAPGSNTTAGVTTPSVPATTVLTQNQTGTDVTVTLTAGSSTAAVTVGGVAVATVPISAVASFRLAAGQFIALTYTNAPTWVWLGD